MTTLDCGGKAACCHINTSHRHCEHCDAVLFAALEHNHNAVAVSSTSDANSDA